MAGEQPQNNPETTPQPVAATTSPSAGDPWAVLHLNSSAADAEIRAAYLQQVRLHPPERDPEAFERIRDAYDQLRNPKRRAKLVLKGFGPFSPLEGILENRKAARQFVGPEGWMAVMKEKSA